ncbi:heterokaryon incompatibility protein-domain-containing protein [Apodospora peruviana]|uniref:Heterokaryon incompatibility protein-domain-containing protein n=1 Tax=Apodospora peruviana TaxID=516989 RepID=A0AAE0M5L9_9PEZI|nr:heterokaryon incompatibility protein-domain-containing protein [Apodospora peruviana]
MRLLITATLDFEQFTEDRDQPPYAILSHTWDPDEVSFAGHVGRQDLSKAGHAKINGSCKIAASEGFKYIWIDTCCIDKSSSAELSKVINSMFRWYRGAAICYAYLSDVHVLEDPEEGGMPSFSASRWFTRGWTLHELLAPTELVFLTSDWAEIGTKGTLSAVVSGITHMDDEVLTTGNWDDFSAAQKMSWAAGRQTTRVEDEAYCLMGLFDVNMPLLYGEGNKAFLRLQMEILRVSEDQSIFAWTPAKRRRTGDSSRVLMAGSPRDFQQTSRISRLRMLTKNSSYESTFEIVSHRVKMSQPATEEVHALELKKLSTIPETHHICAVKSARNINSLIYKADRKSQQKIAWEWYYFRPAATIVPLRCLVGGRKVTILLFNPSDSGDITGP